MRALTAVTEATRALPAKTEEGRALAATAEEIRAVAAKIDVLAAKLPETRVVTPENEVTQRALYALIKEGNALCEKLAEARAVTPENEETARALEAKTREIRVLKAKLAAAQVTADEIKGFLWTEHPDGSCTFNIPDKILAQKKANWALPKDRQVEYITHVDLDHFTWSLELVHTHPKSS
jgi:hypothetical protein